MSEDNASKAPRDGELPQGEDSQEELVLDWDDALDDWESQVDSQALAEAEPFPVSADAPDPAGSASRASQRPSDTGLQDPGRAPAEFSPREETAELPLTPAGEGAREADPLTLPTVPPANIPLRAPEPRIVVSAPPPAPTVNPEGPRTDPVAAPDFAALPQALPSHRAGPGVPGTEPSPPPTHHADSESARPPSGVPSVPAPPAGGTSVPAPPAGGTSVPAPPAGGTSVPAPPAGGTSVPAPPAGGTSVPAPPAGGTSVPAPPAGGTSVPAPPAGDTSVPAPPAGGTSVPAPPAGSAGAFRASEVPALERTPGVPAVPPPPPIASEASAQGESQARSAPPAKSPDRDAFGPSDAQRSPSPQPGHDSRPDCRRPVRGTPRQHSSATVQDV